MKMINIYVTLEEFNNYIKTKLPPEELAEAKDCTFVPIKIGLNECSFDIEALIAPVKNGDTNRNVRYKI